MRAPAEDTSLAVALKFVKISSNIRKKCLEDKKKWRGEIHDREFYDRICQPEAQTEEINCFVFYEWLRIGEISDGAKALATLRQRAATGSPFRTEEAVRGGVAKELAALHQRDLSFRMEEAWRTRYQHVIAEADSTPGEQHLVLCDVRVIKEVAGPPESCITVAIITPHVTLLRVKLNANWWGCPSGMRPSSTRTRLDGYTIDIAFEVDTQLEPSAFIGPLSQLLNDDLKLSTEFETASAGDKIISISFISSSPLRDSIILQQGWRDTFNFDVFVMRNDKGVSVHGSTRPLVSRTASGQQHELNPPNIVQTATYASAFDKKVRDAIARAFAKVTQVDGKHLVCN
jgi:hypothetical protein